MTSKTIYKKVRMPMSIVFSGELCGGGYCQLFAHKARLGLCCNLTGKLVKLKSGTDKNYPLRCKKCITKFGVE